MVFVMKLSVPVYFFGLSLYSETQYILFIVNCLSLYILYNVKLSVTVHSIQIYIVCPCTFPKLQNCLSLYIPYIVKLLVPVNSL